VNHTPNEPEDTRGGCGLDLAAYALGALEPAEAEAFAAHLETCTMCREELAEFEAVVATLPMGVPRHRAPEGLRRRVLDTVHSEAGAPARAKRRAMVWPSWLVMRRPAVALGAAVLVVTVAVFGGLELGRAGGPSTRVYHAQIAGVSGSAEVKVTGGHGELVVRHLSPPPKGKIYEVWLARPHQPPEPTSALFGVTTAGSGDVAVPGSLRGVDAVMVTPEPAGGSRVPTHAPVIFARLT
jgi:anti-sigma-K factor RskA